MPFFFFNDTATTEIYTLSLHDALPICHHLHRALHGNAHARLRAHAQGDQARSEEHTSELQSPCNLVCRLLLEKKKRPTLPRLAALCSTLSLPAPDTNYPTAPHPLRTRT